MIPKRHPLISASFDELKNFVRFFGHHGTPIIIGGWAVWFYNPYLGSVDIDVVGPSYRGEFYNIIEQYERAHAYEFVSAGIGESVARKPIYDSGEQVGEMEIDACSYERVGATQFHEDPTLTLPYSLCDEDGYKKEVRIGKGCVCYVPTKALLLLFKVKAYRDRSYDIKTKRATVGSERLSWLRGKAAKDASDIIALLDPRPRGGLLRMRVDYTQLRTIADKRGLTELVVETLKETLASRSALSNYGRTINIKAVTRAVDGLGR